MRKFPSVIATMLVVFALILAACGGASPSPSAESMAPSEESMAPSAESMEPTAEPVDYLVCMVSDTGGFDDASFNQSGLEGLQRAVTELGIQEEHLQSDAAEDYDRNINQCVSDGADMIVTVGFLLGDATAAAADANPDIRFAIVDFAYDPGAHPNVEGLVYNTAEAAMLAGYASASWSKTKKMGTFGGINIGGPVTDFMDGFIAGANYWNEQKGDNVTVLGGRDPNDPTTGTFTGNFESTDDAKNITVGMLQEGADVVLPVGGPIGGGTFAAIEEQGADAVGLGVDADWCLTSPSTCNLTLVSIMKRIDNSVFDAIKRAMDGTTGEVFVSTLANGGVGLSPFHDYEDQISQSTMDELDALSQAIIDGDVTPSDYY